MRAISSEITHSAVRYAHQFERALDDTEGIPSLSRSVGGIKAAYYEKAINHVMTLCDHMKC
jgi:hypothetical protein